jgi:hypothetical protein
MAYGSAAGECALVCLAGVRDESLWLVRSLDLSGNTLLADAGVTGLALALPGACSNMEGNVAAYVRRDAT